IIMGGVRELLLFVMTVGVVKVSCYPVGKSQKEDQVSLQRRLGELSSNEVSNVHALALLRSIGSDAKQAREAATGPSGDAAAEAATGPSGDAAAEAATGPSGDAAAEAATGPSGDAAAEAATGPSGDAAAEAATGPSGDAAAEAATGPSGDAAAEAATGPSPISSPSVWGVGLHMPVKIQTLLG
uniref:Uncharacterized protein n=1 Tax=Hucho hucho TaxID=62062 RepID=A0A4W5MLN7_9TELE